MKYSRSTNNAWIYENIKWSELNQSRKAQKSHIHKTNHMNCLSTCNYFVIKRMHLNDGWVQNQMSNLNGRLRQITSEKIKNTQWNSNANERLFTELTMWVVKQTLDIRNIEVQKLLKNQPLCLLSMKTLKNENCKSSPCMWLCSTKEQSSSSGICRFVIATESECINWHVDGRGQL